ncbi:hypothetical protein CDL12_18375 [Handroanthus impetiginosus]|uniref:CUE domain-containing protein n=1 Tax=Handroanthus impetiginosus TaxID=429701 RepID=A0A2G9GUR8_9LAMI|nr:hypothetical protein CDL12_18375 [Handroanthus impetiginosus]
MKTGTSSLNPYAASYVPLFKRGPADLNKEFNSAHEVNRGNDAFWFGYSDNKLPQRQHQNVSQSFVQSTGTIQTSEFSKRKDHHGGEFFASTSQYLNQMNEKSNFDEDFDMDLAYLQMTFPGISEECLSDVYLANRCDLDAAVDMINQLEIYPDESSNKLPDTLDIGDVPDPQLASQKVKNPTAEAGASTSSPSSLSTTV